MPDREKVIKDIYMLREAIIEGYINENDSLETIDDVLELLKEQEAVKPITENKLFLCPVCKNTLFREQKFCHECGKRIEWEGR